MTFLDLDKKYAGKKISFDVEELGNAVLKPYGLEVVYGDHQVMVLVGGEGVVDNDKFSAYACAMWMNDDDMIIDNVHMEFTARYPEEDYDPHRYNLLDSEYDRGVRIMDEFLAAVTEDIQ